MKLSTKPILSFHQGRLPGAPDTDNRLAVYFEIVYSYTSNSEEVDFLENNGLKILEHVIILGVNPAIPGGDIDLRFNIRPQFDVRPQDSATADDLRGSLSIARTKELYVLKSELVNALNADGLQLNSVKAMVRLSYVHIDYSNSVTIDVD
jgi:hypothetical protein